jgi:hypothetical protein
VATAGVAILTAQPPIQSATRRALRESSGRTCASRTPKPAHAVTYRVMQQVFLDETITLGGRLLQSRHSLESAPAG